MTPSLEKILWAPLYTYSRPRHVHLVKYCNLVHSQAKLHSNSLETNNESRKVRIVEDEEVGLHSRLRRLSQLRLEFRDVVASCDESDKTVLSSRVGSAV